MNTATVRLYFWGGTAITGNSHLINVTANYTVVPEPSSIVLALGGLGMLTLVTVRRRKSAGENVA